jgi:galactokinase
LAKAFPPRPPLKLLHIKALSEAFDVSFLGTELPKLAQRVENLIVGAPCGLMDQLASYLGEPKKLLPIICQPDLVEKPISIPKGIFFIGIDSGVRHSVSGASYSDVRCAAFMGYTIIARSFGVSTEEILSAKLQHAFSKLPYTGYLCNISVNEFETSFFKQLPDIQLAARTLLRIFCIQLIP